MLASPMKDNLPITREGKFVIVTLEAGRSIQEAMEEAGIQLVQPTVALVNGKTADMKQQLMPGDEVRLLPQIAGG